MSRRRRGAGPDRAWSATASCATSCSIACGNGWSPEQIAGRLACDKAATSISHESIYRFIYAQIAPHQRRLLAALSSQGQSQTRLARPQRRIGRRAPSRAVSPSPSAPRPPTTGPCQDIGKPTSCSSKTYGQAILVAHERVSRILILARQPNKAAEPTARNSSPGSSPCHPSCARPSLSTTAPSSPEHYRLKADLGIQTFFCDTHSPWQKGGIENAIGRMRRPLPRKTDLARHPPQNPQCLRRRLQQYPTKMPGLPNPSRGIPGSTVALQMRIHLPAFAGMTTRRTAAVDSGQAFCGNSRQA